MPRAILTHLRYKSRSACGHLAVGGRLSTDLELVDCAGCKYTYTYAWEQAGGVRPNLPHHVPLTGRVVRRRDKDAVHSRM